MSGRMRSRALALGVALLAASGQAQLIDRTKERPEINPASRELSPERRGDIYMARKMYREAGDTYKEALQFEPDSAKLINKLGISYHQLLMLGSARRQYERAWRVDKTYSQALNNLGTVHHAQGNYGKATRAYKRALKVSPYSASIHSNLGTSYFARRKFKLASQSYLKALELDPNVFETKGTFGTMLQERSVGNRGKYYYFMAKAYAGAELWDRSILYIRKALEEGFGGPRKVASDPAFKAMHEIPEFQRVAFPETIASAGSQSTP
ncbi:MAG: tetratricopeptide repeat protein [Bryobacterales bacterium]|nr:tetratricopeptide repeat protein [Bryobacterales bacterium]MDE0264432.1 tetratricopeptide repeat protein [Bryobacterales bacterium]